MEREITHRCGHAQRHHVGGWFVADQDREAARLARKRCGSCTRAAAAAEAGTAPAAAALPPLTGSPRQVAWAERIRRDRLALLHRFAPATVAVAAAVVDARWWIDHRADDPRTMAA